jgi:hypothetical protein
MPPQDLARRNRSQEQLLLDYVRRLEKHKEGREAVVLRLSGLRPFNRRDHHLRAAADNFDPLVKDLKGQLFLLKSGNLYFFFQGEVKGHVESAVQKIRFLFGDDPLLADEGRRERFSEWFVIARDFDKVLHIVQALTDAEREDAESTRRKMDARTALKARQERGAPLTPEVLDRMEKALFRADLSNMVRRQYVCGVTAKGVPEPAFSELFISISDLRETLIPGVNLTANRWLFQHMTSSLDQRMLSMLVKTDHITLTGDISFNLNVGTILSPEFLTFDENITASRRGSLVVEVDCADAFIDLSAFCFARNFVQLRGYRICLDGLTYRTLSAIDRERLGVDFVKLIWDPEMIDAGPEMQGRVEALVKRTGASRIVLSRCDDREALDFGRRIGIRFFQGRQVENLIAEDNRRRELLRLKHRIERG